MMSTYSLVVLSAVIFLLQSSFLPFLFNGIMQPDLWLTVIALSAVILDRKSALILAGAGGFLQDIVTSNFFGLHLLPYLVITLLFLKFGRDRYNRHWYVSLLSVLLTSVIYVCFSSVIMGWAGSRYPSLFYFVYLGIPLVLMNGGCALALHPLIWMLKREEEPRW